MYISLYTLTAMALVVVIGTVVANAIFMSRDGKWNWRAAIELSFYQACVLSALLVLAWTDAFMR
jgi:hypothetical protein